VGEQAWPRGVILSCSLLCLVVSSSLVPDYNSAFLSYVLMSPRGRTENVPHKSGHTENVLHRSGQRDRTHGSHEPLWMTTVYNALGRQWYSAVHVNNVARLQCSHSLEHVPRYTVAYLCVNGVTSINGLKKDIRIFW
jgi:hypothetical protein